MKKTNIQLVTVMVCIAIIGSLLFSRMLYSQIRKEHKKRKDVTVEKLDFKKAKKEHGILAVPLKLNYQGYLTDNSSNPVSDTVTMEFKIFDAEIGGIELWSSGNQLVGVESGIFHYILGNVPLSMFSDGTPRWLELIVNGEVLSPRTEITSVPWAYYATVSDSTGTGGADSNWTLGGNVLYPSGNYGLSMRQSNVLYGNYDSTHVNFGIACTTGTTGSNKLYCTVSGGLLNSASGGNATVGGGFCNTASSSNATIGGGIFNSATHGYATVGGGDSNNASSWWATVGGGEFNTASGECAIVGGGKSNIASASFTTIGGGENNTADSSDYATVCGGQDNRASGEWSTIGGGLNNASSDFATTVAGGERNIANKDHATVAGGIYNNAIADQATVGGGGGNTASGDYTTVSGGWFNNASGTRATVCGGESNIASGQYATVGGGWRNVASEDYATVAGGDTNTASGLCTTVGGGQHNTAILHYAIVGGGEFNTASGPYTTVGGGWDNTASGFYATVSGGKSNNANGLGATVSGGSYNSSNADNATVCGGVFNCTNGYGSVIPGGNEDTITVNGNFSMIFGLSVYVDTPNRVVFFNGSQSGYLGINRDDHDGGVLHPVHVGTDGTNGNGAHLTAGGTWTNGSSREFKEEFQELCGSEILDKVKLIDVMRWRYKGTDEYHIGPVAEDFYEIFNLGTDNRYLASSDVSGVALRAVQELLVLFKTQQKTNQNQQKEIERLQQEIKELKSRK